MQNLHHLNHLMNGGGGGDSAPPNSPYRGYGDAQQHHHQQQVMFSRAMAGPPLDLAATAGGVFANGPSSGGAMGEGTTALERAAKNYRNGTGETE